jgi:hypothetical protein
MENVVLQEKETGFDVRSLSLVFSDSKSSNSMGGKSDGEEGCRARARFVALTSRSSNPASAEPLRRFYPRPTRSLLQAILQKSSDVTQLEKEQSM